MKVQITKRDNFTWLLLALVFLLFVDAIATQLESRQSQVLINLTLMVTIFTAVWSMERGRKSYFKWKVGMSVIIGGLMIGDSIIESNVLAMTQLLATFSFLCLTVYMASRQILFTGAIDRNKIIGAICIYMLLGLAWGFAYLIAEAFFPGSFRGLDSQLWQNNLEQLLYYSMVTLTTLGYGDITPIQPVARFLAYMEAITGIFYTTVLVASLIGVRLAHASDEDAK
jgi:voltage-gated potassium channel